MDNVQWQVPEELYYDRNDYWVKIRGDEAIVGLTAFGQYNTGDILYLELPNAGTVLTRGEKIGSIESGKWVGKLTAPLTGKVIESNEKVELNPHLVNQDAFGEGWLYRMSFQNPAEVAELMDATMYGNSIDEQIKKEKETTAL